MEFYTYAYLRENKTPYYIGKGKNRRAWSNVNRKGAKRPKDTSRILILKRNLTEEEAFRHERYMIAIFGRKDLETGILRNLTDGGDGPSGWIPSDVTKKKISAAKCGKKHSKEAKEKMSLSRRGENNHRFGKEVTAKTRAKIGEANRGRRHTAKARARMSEARRGERNSMFGKRLNEEQKSRMKEAYRRRLSERRHPNARSYIFTSPTGKELLVTGRFRAFCHEQGLVAGTMQNALYRNCSPPPRNGWKVCYAGEAPQPPLLASANLPT